MESIAADVGDEYDVRDVVDAAVRLFGGVDILVNNAGIYPSAPLAELTAATFDRVLAHPGQCRRPGRDRHARHAGKHQRRR